MLEHVPVLTHKTNTLHGKPDRADNPLSKVYKIYGIMIIIVINVHVKTLLALLRFHKWLRVRGFLQIQHGGFLVVMQSRSQVLMLLFSACANTPEVRFVENNDDEEEERTTFLDSGLPQEARVIILTSVCREISKESTQCSYRIIQIGPQCVHVWLTRPRDRRSTLVNK